MGWSFKYDAYWLNIFPMPLGGLPFDIAFFAAGCIAKKNGWFDAIHELKKREYWLTRILSLTILILVQVLATPEQQYIAWSAVQLQQSSKAWVRNFHPRYRMI